MPVTPDHAGLDQPIPFPRPAEGYGLGAPPFRDESLGAWVVSAYADVDRVLRDAATFSSQNVLGPPRLDSSVDWEAIMREDPRASRAMSFFQSSPGLNDGQVHRRARSFINKAFTPARVKAYEASIAALCELLTEAVLDRSGVAFAQEFAVPLTVRVIAQALGMPTEDSADFRRWSDGFEGLTTLEPGPAELEAYMAATVEFTAYITPLLERRRREPTGDIISAVASENDAGERLKPDEVVTMVASLMLAANETTTGALCGTMMYLVRKPELQAQVRADPTLIPTLVEEGLRLTAPAQALFRTATADAEVGGAKVAKGDHVYLRFAAANRDVARFDEPLCPHLSRPDKRHLTFGRGPHVCPGAPLARAELQLAFETLLARTSEIALSSRDDSVVPTTSEMTMRVGELYLDIRS